VDASVRWQNCQSIDELSLKVKDSLHVQDVDVSGNQLPSLQPLGGLRDVLSVQASNNKLTECLDFGCRSCSVLQYEVSDDDRSSAWDEGAFWIGSTLESADLSCNQIRIVRNLDWHRNLRYLNLSNNFIEEVHDLSSLVWLEELNLDSNNIYEMPYLGSLQRLSSLGVDNNHLVHLGFALKIPELRRISCSNNKIGNIAGLKNCLKLQVVDARGNNIQNFRAIQHLANLKSLETLWLESNPIHEQHKDDISIYRRRIIYRLQQLAKLDDQEIVDEEVVSSLNFYGEDLQHRKDMFFSVFPDKQFISVVDPYFDEEFQIGNKISELSNKFIDDVVHDATSVYEAKPGLIAMKLVSGILSKYIQLVE